MIIRERIEQTERQILSPRAAFAAGTRGRQSPEAPCSIRTEYQRDRDRIIHCKSFRRLKHKTQVFLAPEGDHYRTRLTHTMEVAQISRTAARALQLNEDLTEATALGHDLGHTPFGHIGEDALSRYLLSLIHISEPTRLGMISYAVFCLKKKKHVHSVASHGAGPVESSAGEAGTLST